MLKLLPFKVLLLRLGNVIRSISFVLLVNIWRHCSLSFSSCCLTDSCSTKWGFSCCPRDTAHLLQGKSGRSVKEVYWLSLVCGSSFSPNGHTDTGWGSPPVIVPWAATHLEIQPFRTATYPKWIPSTYHMGSQTFQWLSSLSSLSKFLLGFTCASLICLIHALWHLVVPAHFYPLFFYTDFPSPKGHANRCFPGTQGCLVPLSQSILSLLDDFHDPAAFNPVLLGCFWKYVIYWKDVTM